MEKTDITIIGAGVVGLAVAARLSRQKRSCIIVEKNPAFGQETSSRNSEVIHSGIYYPPRTLKATLCVQGNTLLYAHCNNKNIQHKRTGKIVVATKNDELEKLHALKENGLRNGVQGLEMLSQEKLRTLEPNISALAGLLVPSTGILDTHALMQSLLTTATENGALISYSSEVVAIEKTAGGFIVSMKNDDFQFLTTTLINCAGLNSDSIAQACGIDVLSAGYKLHYSRGIYFRTNDHFQVTRLIYPVPHEGIHSLGIHYTLDLAGNARFGPDAEYIQSIDYTLDENKKNDFCNSIRNYLPAIKCEHLYPDTVGIRPKLQGPRDGFKDFIIREESDKGLSGLINLIGIESPGLTASLAIAEHVEKLL